MSTETNTMLQSAAFALCQNHSQPIKNATTAKKIASCLFVACVASAVCATVVLLVWKVSPRTEELYLLALAKITVLVFAPTTLLAGLFCLYIAKLEYTPLAEQFEYLAREVYGVKISEFYRLTADELRTKGQETLKRKAEVMSQLEFVTIPGIECFRERTLEASESTLENAYDKLVEAGIIQAIPEDTLWEEFVEWCLEHQPVQ